MLYGSAKCHGKATRCVNVYVAIQEEDKLQNSCLFKAEMLIDHLPRSSHMFALVKLAIMLSIFSCTSLASSRVGSLLSLGRAYFGIPKASASCPLYMSHSLGANNLTAFPTTLSRLEI